MNRIAVFLASAVVSLAQVIPNSYIVEFSTEPAAAVSAAKKQRFNAGDTEVQARQLQIAKEHSLAERTIRGLGGTVNRHFYSVLNGVSVTMTPEAAARMARMPGVRSVEPVYKHHVLMDQALSVHRVTQAWQTLSSGSSGAGAGIKIGILDTGIDASHPAFQNFSTPMPSGFPIMAGGATQANVNNKVIVSRVYTDLASGVDNTTSDGNDFFQHGSTVAGIAAGLPTDPKSFGIGMISGIAPGAWLGNYKVGDDFGDLSSATFISGLEDALNDGMNVVNYSAGGPIFDSSQENGIEARAIANAVAGGMVVVIAAGNGGPALDSVSSPGASPAAIAVGAVENQRWFWFAVTPAGGQPIYAVPPEEELTFTTGDITGPLVDVASVASGDTHACSALPPASLSGKIALIQRGSGDGTSCLFETKLNNAKTAGAIGAIVYDNTSRAFFDYTMSGVDVGAFELSLDIPPLDINGNPRAVYWDIGAASLPAMLVSQADGAKLLQAAQSQTTVDMDFDGKTSLPYPSNQITDFSSVGPTPGANIKPDIVAVGDWLVAPTSTALESTGCNTPFTLDLTLGCYPAYTFLDTPYLLDFAFGFGFGALFDDGAGTSFSTPMVTGSVALLMSARPGLSAAQYRSLVTNSSPEFDQFVGGTIAGPQAVGGGMLDVLGALRLGATASPNSLTFAKSASGGSSGSSEAPAASSPTQTVTITNIGTSADTFSVSFKSIDGNTTPSADSTSFNLAAGASKTLTLSLPGSLAAGQYHGFLLVNGSQGQTTLRVPYWYGVVGTTAKNINVLFAPSADPSACDDFIDFRLLDAVGLPVTPAADPTVTTSATRAQVVKVTPLGSIPGTYEAEVVTGRPDSTGTNVFTVAADNITWPIAVQIDNSGGTSCGGFLAASASKAGAKSLGTKRAGRKTGPKIVE